MISIYITIIFGFIIKLIFHFTLDNHKQQHFLYQLFPSFCKINDRVKKESYLKKHINATLQHTESRMMKEER